MAVYSMTGYASVQQDARATRPAPAGQRRLGLEMRAVNSRFLDLSLYLPDELRAQEPQLRALVGQHLRRGKVELRVSFDAGEAAPLQPPDAVLLQGIAALQDHVRTWLPDAPPLSVSDALRLSAQTRAPQADWSEPLLALAQQAIETLVQARAREGARLATMLHERVQQLRALAAQAEPLVPQLVQQQRQRFLQRWAHAMQLAQGEGAPEVVQERALAEATAFALRIDVAEEITRLHAHLDEITRLLAQGGELGKRLDFLIQELHREANTLGSKSASIELTRVSVDMKVLIEQMREQVQNIE
ncbi:MAG: YicC family protein [Comamonadaceae bacterium]|nr:YicC family protein [Comamonadaceae bacterium]